MNRFACVWVPFFIAAAYERCEPDLRERALAVIEGTPPTRRVVEANAVARAEGVRLGMTEVHARARCPALVSRSWFSERVTSAHHVLLESTFAVSPRVEDGGAGVASVDLRGLDRLFGGVRAIGHRLIQHARSVGFSAQVGIAGSRMAARVAASRSGKPVTVIPPGQDREALAPIPIAVLGLPSDLVEMFEHWGVRTLGELAALPREGIALRFGAVGLHAHDLAEGRDRAPFCPYTPPLFFEEAQGLEWEIVSLEALVPVLGAVLERLAARLQSARVATDALDLRLQLASGEHHERTVSFAYPIRDAKPMLVLLRLALEAQPPSGAVTRVAVSAHPVRPETWQGGLWQPLMPEPRDLATLLVRLVELVSAENVGSPLVSDTHRPDAFTIVPFALPRSPEFPPALGMRRPVDTPLALRRFRPPRPIEVEADDQKRPRTVKPAGEMSARETPSTVGRQCEPSGRRGREVSNCAGPWRASGEWWDASAWARDEWDVALGDGTLCRLAQDRLTGRWFLDGVYD